MTKHPKITKENWEKTFTEDKGPIEQLIRKLKEGLDNIEKANKSYEEAILIMRDNFANPKLKKEIDLRLNQIKRRKR